MLKFQHTRIAYKPNIAMQGRKHTFTLLADRGQHVEYALNADMGWSLGPIYNPANH